MQVLTQAFGDLRTNCYIIKADFGSLIIDPGFGAFSWCMQNANDALAVLCTHAHFDHIYDAKKLKDELNVPIYMPRDDDILASSDPFCMLREPLKADILIKPNESVKIGDFACTFHHFAGHCPGCSAIEIDGLNDTWFCGDFLFKNSVGRWDFEFSSGVAMKESLERVLLEKRNLKLYCGHGPSTYLDDERENIQRIIDMHIWR